MGDISHTPNLGQQFFNGPIEFPGLNITVNPPENFFGTAVHWYGVLIALGILLAVVICMRVAKKQGLGEDAILDVVIFGVPVSVICARIYYVAFKWDSYKGNLGNIFKIWEGGIAIYGAIIGAVATAVVYCLVKKIKPYKLLDVGCIGLAVGQSVGRWGNFINREAFGGAASSLVPWRMRLYTDSTLTTWAEVHPTFLYESLWNACVVFVLLKLTKHKKFEGQVFWTYVLLYGLGRLWIEGLRSDSLYLGPVRISQIVALITSVAAAVVMIISAKRTKNTQII